MTTLCQLIILTATLLTSLNVAEYCTYLSEIYGNPSKLKNHIQEVIADGKPAAENQFTFIVVVMAYVMNVNWTLCAGSLVRDNIALTAGHCVIFSKQNYHILVGAGDILSLKDYSNKRRLKYYKSHTDMSTITEIRIKEKHIHPQFDYAQCRNDLALLVMLEPFPGKLKKTTIAINFERRGKRLSCTIIGYGINNVLRQIYTLSYLTNVDISTPELGCKSRQSGSYLCLADGNPQMCIGDSGGPVVCNEELYGVASHVYPLALVEKCALGVDAYFTDLYPHFEWVSRINATANYVTSSSIPLWCGVLGASLSKEMNIF